MKKIILVICMALCACSKKSSAPAPAQTITTFAASVGLQFEHAYSILPTDTFNKVIFHKDSITECRTDFSFVSGNKVYQYDSISYPITWIESNLLSISVLKGGLALIVALPYPGQYKYKRQSYHFGDALLFQNTASSYYGEDTAIIGTFTSGNVVQNAQPTLGYENNGANPVIYGQLIY